MLETWVLSLGQENSLEKGMTTFSSTLARRIPWTEEPGGPQSMGSQRFGHNWVTSTHIHLTINSGDRVSTSLYAIRWVSLCQSPSIGSSQQSIQLWSSKREPEPSFCHYDDAKSISFFSLLKSYIKILNKNVDLCNKITIYIYPRRTRNQTN